MNYTHVDLDDLIEMRSSFSYTLNTFPKDKKNHLVSPSLSDKVNQIPQLSTPLGRQTVRSPNLLTLMIELDKDVNLHIHY